jgi:hypothetical protein
MKSTLLTIFSLMLLPLAACAQSSSNFGGTWVANVEESEPAVDTNYWFGRIENEVPGQPDLRVEQDADTISVYEEARVLSRYDYPAVYVADGKAHKVTDSSTGMAQETITTSWDDGELVIETVMPWGGMPGNITLHAREVWKLSSDGDKLYITTTRSTPANEVSYTRVYDRG